MAIDPAEIHYGIRGQKFGPVDLHTLVERLRAGQISGDDFLWDEDLQDWVAVSRYRALLASLSEDLPEEIAPDDPRLMAMPGSTPDSAPPGRMAAGGAPRRIVAWIIDGFALMVPMMIWMLWAEGATDFDMEAYRQIRDPSEAEMVAAFRYLLLNQLGIFLIRGIYHSLLESSAWQATLGKRAMGIQVTDESGGRISLARAAGRHFARIVCELTLFLGYVVMLFDARGQGLHDRIAGTLVVRDR